MFNFRNKSAKLLTTAVLIAAFSMSAPPAAYADGPAGPASDTHIAEHNNSGATGPGSDTAAAQPGDGAQTGQAQTPPVQPETQPGAQPQAQPEIQTQPQAQIPPELPEAQPQAQPEAQPETQESTDGKVLSGGRWIDPSKPMIALTFDDGPYAPVGNRIMDCLEQYNGRSTFFVVGNRVSQYKTEIRRMHDNGHEIANHTYEHKYLTKLGAEAIRSQIERCNDAVAAITGEAPKLVRLPGGLKNSTVLANVHYPMIMWNIDTMDWKTKNAQKTIAAVVGKVHDGDIVLMHELYTASGDAAVSIIPALTEQGFQLVTVSEMARFRGGVSAGKIYNKFRP